MTELYGWILFAQEGAAKGPAADGGAGGSGLLSMLMPILMIGVVFYLLLLRPERRKMAEHRSMLDALKKNDRVVTSGGIYGVVLNVHREADKVTLRIDESNNTKIDVTLGSVVRVMSDDSAAEKTTT